MSKNVLTRNTISGVVGFVPESYLDHPVFGKQLERVPEGTKSFEPALHKAKDSDGDQVDDSAQKKTGDKALDKIETKLDGKPAKSDAGN